MKFRKSKEKLNMIRAAALVILMAALCLAGCGTSQSTVGSQNAAGAQTGTDAAGAQTGTDAAAVQTSSTNQGSAGTAPSQTTTNTQPTAPSHTTDTALPLEEMGKLCYYRDERDAQFDADMEIVEGRIDAMTDGNYLKEETELETTEGTKYAVNFYIPMDVYGDYSLRDISRILISRPLNLWLSNNTSSGPQNFFGDKIPLPRSAIESAEKLYGCPEFVNPLDFGMKEKEFNYLTIKLTEEYCAENPQIWEWPQPFILQDIEGYEGYASLRVIPDVESRSLIITEEGKSKGRCSSLLYSYTHEPLSNAFFVESLPVVEWESGEAIKGAGQIENTEFTATTVVNGYAPEEAYVSDRNWEQTLQAIRERLDSTGIPYALGRRPGNDRSIMIRMELGLFADNFMDYVVKNSEVSFSALGESLKESPSDIIISPQDQSSNSGASQDQSANSGTPQNQYAKRSISLDMSALRKETFNKLSMNCEKAGGGRIVLRVNDVPFAYGYCDKTIKDGRFVMDHNGFTAEDGFTGEMSWMPEFLGALICGTPIPTVNSSQAAVTFKNTEQVYLSEDGQFCIPPTYSISRQNLYDEIESKIGDMKYTRLGVLTSGTPCLQFAMPEGESQNEQIAATMSRVFKALRDEIFTYWMRFDFVDEYGNPVLMFTTYKSYTIEPTKFGYSLYYQSGITAEDEAEILKLLSEDASLADLAEGD